MAKKTFEVVLSYQNGMDEFEEYSVAKVVEEIGEELSRQSRLSRMDHVGILYEVLPNKTTKLVGRWISQFDFGTYTTWCDFEYVNVED